MPDTSQICPDYWLGYARGYRDCEADELRGEPGLQRDFFAPFIERGASEVATDANPERQDNGCIYREGDQ